MNTFWTVRKYLTLLLLLTTATKSGSTESRKLILKPISESASEIIIEENVSNLRGTKIDSFSLVISVVSKLTDSTNPKLNFTIVGSDLPNNPKVVEQSIKKLSPDQYEPKNDTIWVRISTDNINQSINEDKTALLLLNEDIDNPIKIRLVSSHRYDGNKPFWIEMGANLDLIDGLQANNLFGGVFLYKRDIRPLTKNKSDNIAIFAGVYESKTLSSTSGSNFRTFSYYNDKSFYRPDSAYIFSDTGAVSYRQQVRNVGLFFAPQVRLSDGTANADGVHLFFSLWAELQWQRITNTLQTDGVRRLDSISIHRSDISKFGPMLTTEEMDIRSHYFGAGFPIFMKWNDANLFFNPIVGGSNQPREKDLLQIFFNKDHSIERNWFGFYVLQFRLSEEHYGLAFSGEVRGLLVEDSRPFVTLVLSKKFDLSKLIEFK
ncbi:MAG: hypothetical protein JSS78_06770 [Bacteroidetes bacterium]|nr:hypothetical protein [Bacteroidota bacterium]